jgi:hypothetical protein
LPTWFYEYQNIPLLPGCGSDVAFTLVYGALLDSNRRKEGQMRISRKLTTKSSHDLILIVGAAIAIAIMITSMLHSWRPLPPKLGMNAVVTVAVA